MSQYGYSLLNTEELGFVTHLKKALTKVPVKLPLRVMQRCFAEKIIFIVRGVGQ